MADPGKFTDKAAELAGHAAAAAGPLKEKASELAGQAAAAAGPLKDKASELAGQAAAAAGPLVEQGRTTAAHGVDVLAENLDKLTRGKYSDQIHSVAAKVGGAIDTGKQKPAVEVIDPLSAEPPSTDLAADPLRPEPQPTDLAADPLRPEPQPTDLGTDPLDTELPRPPA
jgi:hypothetical protein